MNIFLLVELALSKGASDVHLVADSLPLMRINGTLQPVVDMQPMTPDDIDGILQVIASDEQISNFEKRLELDFSWTFPNVGRIRCNASKQRGTTSLAIRLVPSAIPSIEELGLPSVCRELVLRPRGLVVISGPTGSGKSTTLSAMINYLNSTESRRVITIEDPIEYVYSNDKCVITQRELGSDTRSFAEALKHVLRQDPNVILVGEMRDYETAAAVLTIAETGHLVLTTGHATSASQTVERIIDLFPAHERPLAQARLASFLNAILCQILVPKADGTGRVVAVEIMLASPATRNTIREGRIYQLPNAMITQARQGMVMLDNVLVKLYHNGLISYENMFAAANDPEEISKLTAELPSQAKKVTLH
ncbi:MAG: PilT/PilU family type 4a pilus ATPase [Chloroflexi bacterium]|nr:PilT/PilU family type 4a pilus ATPase [Chloroflexota bacterium]